MLSGQLYNPMDEELTQMRLNARLRLEQLNASSESQPEIRKTILQELIPNQGKNLWLNPPFYCDYGVNIHLGDNVFFNFNCTLLDVAEIRIGHRTLIGPNVQIYTPTHPIGHTLRASGVEAGKAISIGDDVWIGGGVVICPGVRIGNRTIIGAGSVVTKDIPDDVIAVGNPCRILKRIETVDDEQ